MCPLHRYSQYIIFSDRYTISSFQIYKLYSPHGNTHILFSAKHSVSTSRINTLYILNRNAHYILFRENTLYPLFRNKHYILFSDYPNNSFSADKIYVHSVSYSQIDTLYHLFRYENCIHFTQIHISSFQINSIFPLHRNTYYILYTEMPIISNSQLNTIRPPQINTICSFSLIYSVCHLFR
jgi:hypothetical protein